MAVRLPDPRQQLFGVNGEPLAFGKMYTYEAGTSTPLATFTDADETGANPNPVELDASGWADVFWSENILYRVVVEDSVGNVLYTVDDFGGSSGGGGGGTSGGFGAATTIASATATDLGSISSHFAVITGTTTITSFGSSANINSPIYLVRVQSAGLEIEFNSNILNPWMRDITTTQNDYFLIEYLGSSSWKIYAYFRGTGTIDTLGVTVYGNTSSGGTISLGEDSDNGTNTVSIQAPSTVTSDKVQTLQDANGTIALMGNISTSYSGLVIVNNSGTPNTQVDVDANFVGLSDTSGNSIKALSVNLTINCATTGANGLDTGVLANNTWYYVYVISDGSTVAGLMSLSATAPTMPGSYTYKARVGAFRTGGSATFLRIRQMGNIAQYVVATGSTTPNMPILASGTAGSPTTPTWVAVPVGSFVPSTASCIDVFLHYPSTSSAAQAAPNNAYGSYQSITNPPPVYTANGASTATGRGQMVLQTTDIYWASTGANNSLFCVGWVDNL